MPPDDALAQIFDRTAQVENLLNQLLEAYLGPRKEAREFLWVVLMDSSILPLGSKVKIAMAIAQKLKVRLDQDALHKVLSLRNAFAHHATNAHPVLTVGETPDLDQVTFTLQIITNSGKITRKRREDALTEFSSSYTVARASLVALLTSVRSSQQTVPPRVLGA